MRALFGVIIVGLTAVVAGFIGYQAGISSAVATTAATSGTVVYHAGWGFGFPWFGFLLFPFFLFLCFGLFAFAFGGRRRWGGGPGWGYGPQGYTGNPDDPRRQWIADAHRRLHEEEAARGTAAAPSAGTPPASAAGPFDPPPPTAG
jgi:hypothetical protein